MIKLIQGNWKIELYENVQNVRLFKLKYSVVFAFSVAFVEINICLREKSWKKYLFYFIASRKLSSFRYLDTLHIFLAFIRLYSCIVQLGESNLASYLVSNLVA